MVLDFFVLFSSMASLWGEPNRGSYTTANTFLDGLAHYRRSQGLTAVSINWGSWAKVGQAAALEEHIKQRQTAWGIGQIEAEQGLQALAWILSQSYTQVGVISINTSRYAQQFLDSATPDFLTEVVSKARPSISPELPKTKPYNLVSELKQIAPDQRPKLLVKYLQKQVGAVLGLDPSQVDVQQPLPRLGLDSLMAIELRNRVQVKLGLDIPMVQFLIGTNILRMAEALVDQFIPDARPVTTVWEEGEL
jgi:acyl carrier protein